MDNFHIDVCAEKTALELVLKVGFRDHTATGYTVSDEKGLVFYWRNVQEEVRPLPYPLSADNATHFVAEWLASDTIPRQDWCDHDGDNGTDAFRIYTGDWGRIEGCGDFSFLGVIPIYAWYGK